MGLIKEPSCKGKVLYFECGAGISGDMVLGALIHLGVDAEDIKRALSKLHIAPFNLVPNYVSKNGVSGVDLDVIIYDEPQHDHDYYASVAKKQTEKQRQYPRDHDIEPYLGAHGRCGSDGGHSGHDGHGGHDGHDEHGHTSYAHIKKMIDNSDLSANAKRMARDIFAVIAQAEAAVHNRKPEHVTFHEVGAVDSVLDIVGTAVAIDILGVDKILCGPVHDGQGFIKCQHGVIPVPVPAVMEMLKLSDIPLVIETDVKTEMVTPTGFGILEGLKAEFRPTVGILPEKVGYGFGKRDTGRFGAVRAILGKEYV